MIILFVSFIIIYIYIYFHLYNIFYFYTQKDIFLKRNYTNINEMTKLFFVLITSTWKNCNVDGGGILGGKKPQKNVTKYIQVDNRLIMTY